MLYQTTPEHAATQLLALEPLTFNQLGFYACWDHDKTRRVTNALLSAGTVVMHTDQIHGCRFWVTEQLRAHLNRQAAQRAHKTGQPHLRRVA